MPRLDRDALLARTDLGELATEICGPSQGRGRGARWHCPNPDHPDAHPSMGIYLGAKGPRWKCHACGEGGTAIDLLMISASMSAGEAMRHLAHRAGMDAGGTAIDVAWVYRPRSSVHERPERVSALTPVPAVERFVAQAVQLLWQPAATLAQRHLRDRGFTADLLHANRVGFDPGPGVLPRPRGLPRRSPGIVYPVLERATSRAVYYQVRSLSPRGAVARKYDQPTAEMAPNPRFASIQNVGRPSSDVLVIAEGIPDGLTAAHAGMRAVAVLGVSHAGIDSADALAQRILQDHPAPGYVVCFDPNPVGVEAGRRLAGRLAGQGAAVADVLPPDGFGDLNDWWQRDGRAVARQLADAASMLTL
jgi:hypothetical protein